MSSYGPQFAYKSPADCEEQRCVFSFDHTNTPWLATTIAAGAQIPRIPLLLDRDADFYLRGIQMTDFDNPDGLEIRLEDPKGNPLSDRESQLEEMNFQYPALYCAMSGAGIVPLDNADDYGVFCQSGSRLYLHLFNNGANNVTLTGMVITLHGVKRYSGERCAA